MKYQNVIDRIRSGKMSRADIEGLRANAIDKHEAGDPDAAAVLKALGEAKPIDDNFYFMGFCPWGNIANRLDRKWREEGVLEFDYDDAEDQLKAFQGIMAGDLVILKIMDIGKGVMNLYGHGRVRAVDYTSGIHYLRVDWAEEGPVIAVPLMGCTRTVNRKPRKKVLEAMPPEFFRWLGIEKTA